MTRGLLFVLAAVLTWSTASPSSAADRVQVKAGVEHGLFTYTSLDPASCTAGPLPIVVLRVPPAHGQVHIFKNDNKLRSSARCSGRTIRGVAATYRSAGGFRGTDRAVFEVQTEMYSNTRTMMRSETLEYVFDVK